METGVSPVFLFMAKGKCLKFKDNRYDSIGLRKQKQKMYPVEGIIRGIEALSLSMIETEGLELVHVEFVRESIGWVLRFYIDRPGGITIQDCADISRLLGDLFDVALESWLENNVQINISDSQKQLDQSDTMYLPPYTLEVSSPGEKRHIKKLKDFVRFQGEKIVVKVHTAINGQKRFKGILSEVTDTLVAIETSTSTVAITHENIRIARLDA